ncbi:hypothetical protein, partial [Pseudomonas sp. NPDC086278]|uniref:hypothetical protein n=1 Tax=Pseudomonas sp. NPDC086278 TaxID=3390646 RepID=UPI003D028B51
MAQYVFTMHRLGKVVPPKREILKNISLSFFPGAKIGVLGLNGSAQLIDQPHFEPLQRFLTHDTDLRKRYQLAERL